MEWAHKEVEMRELMKKGKVPCMQDLEDGKIDFNIFIGPTTRRWAGIGKNTEEGEWNDIREDLEWNVDRDQSQAGQAVGAIESVVPAALLVKEMMQELVKAMHILGRIGSQFAADAKFEDIIVPNTGTFTLENIHMMHPVPKAKL